MECTAKKSLDLQIFTQQDIGDVNDLHCFLEWLQDILNSFGMLVYDFVQLELDNLPEFVEPKDMQKSERNIGILGITLQFEEAIRWNIISQMMFERDIVEFVYPNARLRIVIVQEVMRKLRNLLSGQLICDSFMKRLMGMVSERFLGRFVTDLKDFGKRYAESEYYQKIESFECETYLRPQKRNFGDFGEQHEYLQKIIYKIVKYFN